MTSLDPNKIETSVLIEVFLAAVTFVNSSRSIVCDARFGNLESDYNKLRNAVEKGASIAEERLKGI